MRAPEVVLPWIRPSLGFIRKRWLWASVCALQAAAGLRRLGQLSLELPRSDQQDPIGVEGVGTVPVHLPRENLGSPGFSERAESKQNTP